MHSGGQEKSEMRTQLFIQCCGSLNTVQVGIQTKTAAVCDRRLAWAGSADVDTL